nr:hypothetical protein [Pseudomonas parafulva]
MKTQAAICMNVSTRVSFVDQQLIYLLYGKRRTYQLEAKFSILTALARCEPGECPVIRVLTDEPQAFAGWPVEVVRLDAQTLQAWAPDGSYTHRRKACAIAQACEWAQKTIFIDTDTVFLQPAQRLFEQVGAGQFLIDEVESSWAKASRKRHYRALTRGLAATGQLPPDDLQLCNSGVLGLAHENAAVAQRAIARIDDWAAYSRELLTIEQIAFSFEIYGARINQARGLISHYYAMKPYLHAIQDVFFARHGEGFHAYMPALALQVPAYRPLPSWLMRVGVKLSLLRVPRELRGVARKLLYGSAISGDEYLQACKVVWWRSAIDDMRMLGGLDWTNGWPAGLPRLKRRDERVISKIARESLNV